MFGEHKKQGEKANETIFQTCENPDSGQVALNFWARLYVQQFCDIFLLW